jgi:eukaryotic-like serine/threonine-protein kinase
VQENERLVDDLAVAVLDGTPIDWAVAECRASDVDRPLIEQLKIVAALAGIHRPLSGSSGAEAGGSARGRSHALGGEIVGIYRLGELLGRGGMGEVYLAQRVDGRFEQSVALKVVKRGMDTGEILRRFARERRILARLQHPGIARLLDAGETSDGRPFFVMERVEGERITDYCRTRSLPLTERLRLLAACCDAVDAAHRSLVVHRDLKPSNILVTSDGQVKLLDFGIAKLLEEDEKEAELTRAGSRLLTAAYAAPEQIIGGHVSVGTDVFSLGVVLYELLTDVLPYDRRSPSPSELVARVEREVAARPSAVVADDAASGKTRMRRARQLHGDLDAIALRALAHEPDRRYASAAALAADLRRYLSSKPIEARPDSKTYRLRKFVVRHRFAVSASSLTGAAIVAALAVSLHETAAARREGRRAAAAEAFLSSLFQDIDPDRYVGSPPTVRDLLERGSQRAERELRDQPELRSDMEALLGQVFDQMLLSKQGETEWRRAFATRQAVYGPDDPRTLKAKKGLAISLARQSRYGDAEPLFKELLAQEQALGDQRELGSVLVNYGNVKRITGDYAASAALFERAVALLETSGEPATRSLAAALNNLGLAYRQLGRSRDAVNTLERALAIHMKNAGPRSTVVARASMNLSLIYRDLNDLEKAERHAQEALAVQQALLPPNDPSIGLTLTSLGEIAQRRGENASARTFFERSLSTFEASPPDDPESLVCSLRDLARLSLEEGDGSQALDLYERALTVRQKAFGDRHRRAAESWSDVARARSTLGDTSGAIAAARTSVDIFRSAGPSASTQLASSLVALGDILSRNGRSREALTYLEEADAIWRKTPPTDQKELNELGTVLAATRSAVR